MSFCKSDQKSMPVVGFLTRNGSGMFGTPKLGDIGALETRLISRLHRSDADGWVEAIMEEYSDLQQKDIFVEVEVPPDKCIHEGRLVFSEKIGSDGEVVKKKVRLVAKGYTEIWGEDYWNTYSPTLGRNSLLSLLAYAAAQDLEIHQMDAIAAYLNSDLTEIYSSPPEGIPIRSGKVWRLKKALYGLKQAGLEWYCTLRSHIKSVRYVQSGYD